MPWKGSVMSQRRDLVTLARADAANVAEICRRFGVSRRTAYKWIERFELEGPAGLADRSRRPHRSPGQTTEATERRVLAVRREHRVWGGRKIRHVLLREGFPSIPSASTITEILRRHGQLEADESSKHRPLQRFEHPEPNDLWQMDFKGHFKHRHGRCHPLTVLDDHSRFGLGLQACPNEGGTMVKAKLTRIFRQYGLPKRMLVDNGSPWGSDKEHVYTPLTAWLIRLGVGVVHGRPYHPQTQGKDERFHRTLVAEVIRWHDFRDNGHCQRVFDRWLPVYNYERPHEALGMGVPGSRYRASGRSFPQKLPPIEYGPGDLVRKVCRPGQMSFQGHTYRVPKAFCGHPIAMRPTVVDGAFEIYFCNQRIGKLDARRGPRGGRRGLTASARSARSGVQPPP